MKNNPACAGYLPEGNHMNILIVGLGSMGKRRARLIASMRSDCSIFGVDSSAERREEAEGKGIKAYDSIAAALSENSIDAGLVCTAPVSHNAIITELLEKGIPVFSELNLVDDGYDRNIELSRENNTKLFLSSTMLYRRETRYIKEQVDEFRKTGKNVNYVYHIGQYLPDWHPWENYKNFFVSNPRTGGVREIMAIDMPWLVDVFGDIESFNVISNSVSDLELGYPDTTMLLLTHKGGTIGTLVIDVVSPKAVRNFECFGEGIHLFWEGNPKGLFKYDGETKQKEPVNTYVKYEQDPRYSDNIVETAYVDELQDFFDMLEKDTTPLWSFEKDRKLIDLFDRIEQSGKIQ